MNPLVALLTLFAVLPAFAQKRTDPKRIQLFDRYVETVRKQWDIPGMSITVVKEGRVILTKRYRVREAGKPEPVDAQTLFACASTGSGHDRGSDGYAGR